MSTSSRVKLSRYGSTPMGTFGRLTVGDWGCYTVEPPWLHNRVRVSCIPPGVYPLRLRASAVVARASAWQYKSGWEVCGVPGRTYIMIHPGNTADDVKGCIAPGRNLGMINDMWAVTPSRPTFGELMAVLSRFDEWEIEIGYQGINTRASKRDQ